MIIETFLYPGFAFMILSSLIVAGLFRKVSARMQSRIGPPIIQPIYDMIKLMSKDNIFPRDASIGFRIFPAVALSSVLIAGLMIPFLGLDISYGSDYLMLIYMLVLSSASLYLAGFSSGNNFATIGSIRGIVLMFSYELPFIIGILLPVIAFSLPSLIPMDLWLAAYFPFAAFSMFMSILAKVEIPPFHIAESHQEVVGGYAVEFSGRRLALIELTHMVKTFVLMTLMISLYLGGASTLGLFVIKIIGLTFLIALCRTLFARLRIDQAFRLYWLFGLIALIDLLRVTLI